MRKILLAAAAAGVFAATFGAGTASAQECIQWPNPLGWDQVEVCHTLPVDLEDILKIEG